VQPLLKEYTDFTQLYTTWGCAWYKIILVRKISREIFFVWEWG